MQELYDNLYYLEEDEEASQSEKPNSDFFKFRQHFSALDRKIGLRGKKILDYGCGVGKFLEIARDGGVTEAMGIELNERARKWACGKGFRVEKAIDQYESAIFDLVYMNDVVEHLRDPVAILREVGRVLTSNGILFAVTMNVNGLKARLLKDRWDLIADPTHFYFYNPKSLRRTLKEAGFERVSEERFVVDFSHHNLPRRILQRVLLRFGLDTGLKMLVLSPRHQDGQFKSKMSSRT